MQRGVEVRAAGTHGNSREMHSPEIVSRVAVEISVEACRGRDICPRPTGARVRVELRAPTIVKGKKVAVGFRFRQRVESYVVADGRRCSNDCTLLCIIVRIVV